MTLMVMAMPARMRLVLASNNAGKLAELRQLFAPLALELLPQPELGLPEADARVSLGDRVSEAASDAGAWQGVGGRFSAIAHRSPLGHHGLGLQRTVVAKAGFSSFVLTTRNYTHATEIVKDVRAFDLVIMNVRSYNFIQAKDISTLFKEANPAGKVMVGGMHTLVSLADMTSHDAFDYICVGGGEGSILEMLHALPKLERITIGQESKSMDSWPKINRHLWPKPVNAGLSWPLEDSMPGWPAGPIATILTSRVCPWRCSFCNESSYIQPQQRKSVDNVIDELNDIYDNVGHFGSVVIHDSMFFQNPSWLTEWLEKYPKRARKVWPYWAAARADTVRKWPELFERLVLETNWELVSIGLESGSDNTLLTLNKECTVQDNLFCIQLINYLGDQLQAAKRPPVKIFSNIMWGVPGEDLEDLYGTIRMVSLIRRPLLSYSHHAPYPGGALGYQLIAEGKSLLNVDQLNRDLGIPTFLAALKESDIPALAKAACWEAHTGYPVPRYMSQEVCEDLIRKALPPKAAAAAPAKKSKKAAATK